MSPNQFVVSLLAILACSASGCMVPRSQFASLESHTRALSEKVASLESENQNLKTGYHRAVDELQQTERELATLDEEHGRTRDRLADTEHHHNRIKHQFAGYVRKGMPSGTSTQLSQLAKTYSGLRYDPQTGSSKLETDVLFDSGSTELKPEGRRMLQQFASIFMNPDVQEVRLVAVGHSDDVQTIQKPLREKHPTNWHLSTARALVVTDYLRKAGVPEDRMGVAAYASHQPVSSRDPGRNRRVEIFLLSPEAPQVGWTETTPTVYR